METHMRAAFFTLLLAISGASAGEPFLTIPKSDAVDRMVVKTGYIETDEVVIKDPKRVERLLDFLKARNDGWEKPPSFTFPTPYRTILLKKDKKLVLVLWQGPNWLGSRDATGHDKRTRSLSEKDLAELLDILGLGKQ
jgi:hypothetical protein